MAEKWKIAGCMGCFCGFSGVVLLIVGLVMSVYAVHFMPVFEDIKERVKQGTGGKCQVYNSSSTSSLYHAVPGAAIPADQRCTNLKDCVCEKASKEDEFWEGQCKQATFEDFEDTLFDGDHGLKVRWPTVNSMTPLASDGLDSTLRGAAVECPCPRPPTSVLGQGAYKPHIGGSALILMKPGPLMDFEWPPGSAGCTLVHWFRGAKGITQESISSKKIAGIDTDISLAVWMNAGELDCVAIPAAGKWTKDDLLVNANKDGVIKTYDYMLFRFSVMLGGLFGGASVAVLLAICSCFTAYRLKPKRIQAILP